MKQFEVVEYELIPDDYRLFTVNPKQGAVCLFVGIVREWTKGIRTEYLHYEAYVPMAEKKLAEIGDEINDRWPGTVVSIGHRIGALDISDIAVVIAVSSPHRKDSYAANEYAIERIKEVVPIWKKEIWEDGEEWIGGQRGYHSSYKEEQ
ncbi:molybdenum cofactor biosynthesis protein MoaE [Macrococcus brunensis]|uniref:Molybdopterin synthase catalytic subunit n=1 Tax=Macrococcus brunensis TaxID=198483 RepID=A0A4R6BF25_9STAP|nr:molybdenum cofactor biosynthesis protein MoaE [Macrococcus brunensis]TDL98437.1 molybdenum cofactor biosynthesis protein MoaE [Macrococcus brunensis]